jgi:ketosteroid isomerase-like protein
MSQENVELARRGFEAWEQCDLETHLSLVHEDVVCRQVGQIDSRTYHGLEGYIEFASEWFEPYEELRFRPSEFIDAGDKVVVEVPQEGRLVGSDQPITGTFWFVITARDGKMARLEIYRERDRALDAAGLREQRQSYDFFSTRPGVFSRRATRRSFGSARGLPPGSCPPAATVCK